MMLLLVRNIICNLTYLAVLQSASTKLVVVWLYVFYRRCCIYDALVCNAFKRCIALYNQRVSINRSPLADFRIGLPCEICSHEFHRVHHVE